MAARRKAERPSAPAPTIETAADIRAGVAALRRKCQAMRRIHDLGGDPPLRREAAGFRGLARIVVSQQLSAASADAIWRRTLEAVKPFRPKTLGMASDEVLRGAGLSRPKIRTLRAVSEAVLSGKLEFERTENASDLEVHEMLTRINGIGPWTADIYMMFCLGRRDAFAPGDLALQVSVQSALALPNKPSAREIEAIAERWRPWRGVAARLLWAFYGRAKRA
jgi:DNA-3-methyladenine glycosylase II